MNFNGPTSAEERFLQRLSDFPAKKSTNEICAGSTPMEKGPGSETLKQSDRVVQKIRVKKGWQ